MNLTEFDIAFKRIKSKGFITSKRKGDRSVGNTLEDFLNIKENNSKTSDLSIGDLKATRKNANSLQTLLTCDYKAWNIKPKEVIETYGYLDSETGLACLRTTFRDIPNNRGFYYDASDDEYLFVKNKNDVILQWKWEMLANRFHKKLHGIVKVYADSEIREDGYEYFHYTDYYVLNNKDPNKLKEAYQNNFGMYIDIRCSYKYNKRGNIYLKNHGTAFRVPESKLGIIFSD